MAPNNIEVKPSDNNMLILNKQNSLEELNEGLASKVLTYLKENEKIRLHADLLTTRIELQEDGIVHIIFDNPPQFSTKENFKKEETKIAIKMAVKNALGKEVSVKYENFK